MAHGALCVVSLLKLRCAHASHAPTPPLASALKPFPAAHSSQASPENPWLHVQVHPPVVPPTVPWAASHGMVSAAPDVLAVHWHEMVLFGGAMLMEHLGGLGEAKKPVAYSTLPTSHPAMDVVNEFA